MEGQFWSVAIVIGPLILAVAIAYALLRQRRLSADEAARRDRATHEAYRENGS